MLLFVLGVVAGIAVCLLVEGIVACRLFGRVVRQARAVQKSYEKYEEEG